MKKEAIAAKSLLKALAVGGAVGGAGYGGYRVGEHLGANRTADAMAAAFTEANQRENQKIRDSFNLFNRRENHALAKNYFQKGVMIGAQLNAAGKLGAPEASAAAIQKKASAEELYERGFNEELEKAGSVGSIIRKSFSNLGKGLMHQGRHAKKLVTQGTMKQKKQRLRNMGKSALTSAKKSKAALGITGGAAAAYTAS